MRFILKTIGYCLVILLIGCLFRGPIFRACIQYTRVGDRPTLLLTNRALQQTIEQFPLDQDADIETMIHATLTMSNQYLHFSGQRKSQDPNQMLEDGRANCIGYAAFFASVLTCLLQKRHQQDQFEVKHLIGKLDFWGYNLHQISNDPFYKDQDYNVITNIKTGKKIFVDPSVADCFWINRVRSEQ